MSFLQPILLWGLLAAAVPIIIHLLNRRRHKTVMWAAMQFLLKATRESRGKKKLRHILILACRALGVASLATAAARPLISGMLGWSSGGRPEVVVVLFDRSASMEMNPKNDTVPRRKLALKRVRDALASLDGARVVLIDSASGNPQEVPSPEVLDSLSSVAATDTAADMPSLAVRAAEFLTEVPGRAEVWMVSDLQTSNWQPDSERWTAARASLAALPQPPRLRVLSMGGDPSPNQSIRLLSCRRAGDQLVLDVELTRNDDAAAPINLPLSSTLNGTSTTSNVTLAGSSVRFRKSLPIPPREESGYGWLSTPGDGNLRDNVAFFAYGPARPVKSLLVAPPGEAANYLALAAAPAGFGGQVVEIVDPSQAATLDTAGVAAIFWAAPLPETSAAEKISRFLSEGGQVVFFAPQGDSRAEFLKMKWSPMTRAEDGKFFILHSWSHDDGLLRDGLDGGEIPAGRLKSLKRRIPEGEFATLARWDDNQTFLARRVVDRGTAWFVATLPDYSWSNLGDADVLLPIAQRAVLAGADRFDSGYLAEVGSRDAATKPGETRERIDGYGTPDPSNVAWQAGIHRYGDRLLALNRPPAEDNPEVLQRENLDNILDGTGYTFFEDHGTSAKDNISRDVWRGFLIAMLCFLISEAVLSLPGRSKAVPAGPASFHPHVRS